MGTISKRFLAEHQKLDREFDALRNAVEGADEPTIVQIWSEFERSLERHLDAEDLLLRRLERLHPDEVRRIRDEHIKIRRLLADLGIRADLHTLRKDVADELIALLRAHAASEERGIYAWADAELAARHARSPT